MNRSRKSLIYRELALATDFALLHAYASHDRDLGKTEQYECAHVGGNFSATECFGHECTQQCPLAR